jgi:hypothetical protein
MSGVDPEKALAFMEALISLDAALTGNGRGDAEATLNEQRARAYSPEVFLSTSDPYALSDFGRSKLFWDERASALCLTFNSTPAVKAKWSSCAAEVAAVEALLKGAL